MDTLCGTGRGRDSTARQWKKGLWVDETVGRYLIGILMNQSIVIGSTSTDQRTLRPSLMVSNSGISGVSS